MMVVWHGFLFLVALGLIWFFAGLLIQAIERLSHYFHRSGFMVAFLVLGFLTSLTEISVLLNSTLQGVPSISAGNLSSASLVIFFLIIPLLAIFGNGIHLKNSISPKNLALALGVISLPPLIASMGSLNRFYGLVLMAAYFVLLYSLAHTHHHTAHPPRSRIRARTALYAALTLLIGSIIVFLAGQLLVKESVYFAKVLAIPASVIGLLVLSVGTNLPELTIALRAILKNRKSIAFGDYVGSSATNTLLMGMLLMLNGSFRVVHTEFLITAVITVIGLSLFWIFARSKYTISRVEGFVLAAVYLVFVILQIVVLSH